MWSVVLYSISVISCPLQRQCTVSGSQLSCIAWVRSAVVSGLQRQSAGQWLSCRESIRALWTKKKRRGQGRVAALASTHTHHLLSAFSARERPVHLDSRTPASQSSCLLASPVCRSQYTLPSRRSASPRYFFLPQLFTKDGFIWSSACADNGQFSLFSSRPLVDGPSYYAEQSDRSDQSVDHVLMPFHFAMNTIVLIYSDIVIHCWVFFFSSSQIDGVIHSARI